ncbi:hypothetical protein F5879DRAFT_1007149 [Lentinula edodes]|nr:hypothetical protein F5879DRAFT_1007149 [Lentinula edodes]
MCSFSGNVDNPNGLLDAFRAHYEQFQIILTQVYSQETDSFLLQLLGEDLEQFGQMVNQHTTLFAPEELQVLQNGVQLMIIDINPEFLHWAYTQRSTSALAHFLGLNRDTVRQRLLDYGIALPGQNPFPSTPDTSNISSSTSQHEDNILDAQIPDPIQLPEQIRAEAASIPSTSSYLSHMSNDQLDSLLSQLRVHYSRAGIRMLDGMLRRLGHIVPYERIRQSLIRIDPIHRVFERIRIRRRGYSVPGPNSLWHHDGHHRKSVHNVRIERLWVDVSHYISQSWNDLFTILEMRYGLDITNANHIWLLQHLFLPTINEQLAFWAESWNHHRISQRNGPARSPEDMFGFDMLVHGIRGDSLDQFAMSDEELEVFGVDWEGLQDEVLLRALRKNYSGEGSGSWLGHRGPPPDLNEVVVNSPAGSLSHGQVVSLDEQVLHYNREPQEEHVARLWVDALAVARVMQPNLF